MINDLNKRLLKLLKFTFNWENKPVDQSMISYYATHGSRLRKNNKPIRVGCNIWVIAEAYDYVIQFEPYQGVKKGKHVASFTK